jgi:hypothetical protein
MPRQLLHAMIAELAQVQLGPMDVGAVARMHAFLTFHWLHYGQRTLVALRIYRCRGNRCLIFAFPVLFFCVLDGRNALAALPFVRDHLVLQRCRHLHVAFFNGVEQIAQLATASAFVYTSMKMTQLAAA